jgi:hypothetical protein
LLVAGAGAVAAVVVWRGMDRLGGEFDNPRASLDRLFKKFGSQREVLALFITSQSVGFVTRSEQNPRLVRTRTLMGEQSTDDTRDIAQKETLLEPFDPATLDLTAIPIIVRGARQRAGRANTLVIATACRPKGAQTNWFVVVASNDGTIAPPVHVFDEHGKWLRDDPTF